MCASPTEDTLVTALLTVHAVLEEEGVDHALCGGIAANLYRDEIRATTDVDIYIACAAAQLVSLARTFEESGWSAHPEWQQADLLRLDHPDLPRVDLLVASTNFERQAIRRAVTTKIDHAEIRVLVPEDLIVLELVAGRARDYEAAAAILNARPRLDREYIVRQLDVLEMEGRWHRVLEEAALEAQDLG